MISDDDYNFIIAFDNATPEKRETILKDHRLQVNIFTLKSFDVWMIQLKSVDLN